MQEVEALTKGGALITPHLNYVQQLHRYEEQTQKAGLSRLHGLRHEIAKRVVDEQRGKHPEFVFTYKGNRLLKMLNSAWQKARARADLPGFRVHDLRHTFGRKSERITTHYSAPDIARLIEAAEKVCER